MTYDNEIILIELRYEDENGEPYLDAIGNNVAKKTQVTRLCNVAAASRSEFFNAATDSTKPAYVFTMHTYEYGNQERVEFNGKAYEVYRTYGVGVEEIELHVRAAIGTKAGT